MTAAVTAMVRNIIHIMMKQINAITHVSSTQDIYFFSMGFVESQAMRILMDRIRISFQQDLHLELVYVVFVKLPIDHETVGFEWQ